ncbi:MAG TPA: hypothetical protein VJB05_03660 [archaeon]|nr:hypothetical protein [archaeon]
MATDLRTDPKSQFHCTGCEHEWVSKSEADKCPECGGRKIHNHVSCIKEAQATSTKGDN